VSVVSEAHDHGPQPVPRLSFAKTASDSFDDDPCACHERTTPGDRRSRVRRRDNRQPQTLGPATQKRGCRRRTEWRRKDRVGNRGQWRQSGRAMRDHDARSGRLSDVAMMQATDFGKRHDPARLRPFDGPPSGASLSSDRWVRAR
jgi:hypothetical protein